MSSKQVDKFRTTLITNGSVAQSIFDEMEKTVKSASRCYGEIHGEDVRICSVKDIQPEEATNYKVIMEARGIKILLNMESVSPLPKGIKWSSVFYRKNAKAVRKGGYRAKVVVINAWKLVILGIIRSCDDEYVKKCELILLGVIAPYLEEAACCITLKVKNFGLKCRHEQ